MENGWWILAVCASSIFAGFLRPAQGRTYGSWVCRQGLKIISSGEFADSKFSPFVSPYTLDDCPARVYLHNINCTFTFVAPEGHHAYVEFPVIELDHQCRSDNLKILLDDGKYHTLCGDATTAFYVATSGVLKVVFVSDGEYRCSGFNGFFSAFLPDEYDSRRHRRYTIEDLRQLLILDEALNFRSDVLMRDLFTAWRMRVVQELNRANYCSVCDDEEVRHCYCSLSKQHRKRRKRHLYDSITPNCMCRLQ